MSNTSASQSPSGTPPASSGLKFSFTKGAPLKPTQSKLSNGTAFRGHDSDEEEDHKKSTITTFENGKVDEPPKKDEKKPLVIKPAETNNEHWLQRRLKMFRPDLVENKPPEGLDLSKVPDTIGTTPSKVGLQITKRTSPPPPSGRETPETESTTTPMVIDEPPKTDDELARELLLAQSTDPTASIVPKIIIPTPMTDTDVYAHDMSRLSDAPTLETYERVPVESFGMGILLGLGWKEGTDLKGNKVESLKDPKKRPEFLGIGAKEDQIIRRDVKGEKISRKDALGGSWTPLKMVNKRTGEVIQDARSEERASKRSHRGDRSDRGDSDRERSSRDRSDRDRSERGGSDRERSSRDRDRDRHDRKRHDRSRYDSDRYDSDRSARHSERYDSDRSARHKEKYRR